MASSINASTSAGVVTTADTSGVLNIQTAGTTAISIDASQAVSFTNQPTYSGGTANGVAYLNGSKVLTTGSALTFDGSTLGITTSAANAKNILTVAATYGAYNEYTNGTADHYVGANNSAGTLFGGIGGANSMVLAAYGNLPIGFGINGSEQMRLTSTGLGVGTTSPTAKLHIGVASAAVDGTKGVRITNPAGTIVMLECGNVGDSFVGTTSGSDFNIRTNNITRATFDNSGNLLVGTTSGSDRLDVRNSTNRIGNFQYTSGTFGDIVFKDSGGTTRGYIEWTSGGTTYSTSSDYRLKENVQPMTGALEKVAQLNPCTYTWKETGKSGQGFIAHELQTVVSEAVVGEKDAVDEEGNPKYQGIDTSFLVATLTAAIQEMKAIIDTQASTITQLQADVASLKGA